MLLPVLKALVTAIEADEERIIKKIVMAIDDTIKTFADSVNATLDKIGANITNIATDEAGLLKEIQDLKASLASVDLSIESQRMLAGIETHAAQMANNSQSLADSVPDVTPPTPPAA